MAICYKDMTFCVAGDNCETAVNGQCHRYMSGYHKANAETWASSMDMTYAPVAWSDYSKRCEHYKPIDKDWKWEGFDFD
jgi:hypothetical protein